jgi:hypothetical protein
MAMRQGDPALLSEPVAQELLQSTTPARLAYVWRDGTPRVVPIWFHWDGKRSSSAPPHGTEGARTLIKSQGCVDHRRQHVAVQDASDPGRGPP